MHRKQELAQSESVGVSKLSPGEVLWRAEWASPMATAMAIQNHTPKQGWIFRWLQATPGAHHSTWKLG